MSSLTAPSNLSSYAGYDVVQRESGTSIKGKTKISKKGNRYIRNALYFPAMVACRYNPVLKENYLRIIQKKTSKMIGQVAIQRKLLALMYTLWKNDTEFIEN
ncbi:transposase [Mucilaginibacter sp. HMF7410]|uniref:Transposase n=1 Tax=Mucilaginibacter arboris TaxID=2682090 RepID=A0A7K1T2K4_9SPHI|nr:transposase [Mucilaginibacter arboris]